MVTPALHDLGPENTATPPPPLPSLADLLSIWQLWSYRDRPTHQIAQVRQARDTNRVTTLTHRLNTAPPGVGALDALAANHQLATLLIEWQGDAIRAARHAGASWNQIATATGTTAERACADCLAKLCPTKSVIAWLASKGMSAMPHPPFPNPDSQILKFDRQQRDHRDAIREGGHRRRNPPCQVRAGSGAPSGRSKPRSW